MILLTLVLLSFFFSRLVNLTLIPVFADEAIYIHWAQTAWHDHNQRFVSLMDGKPPLHTWLMIPFLKVIKDPLVAGRLLSVTAGLATLIGLYLLVKKIFNQKTGLISVWLMVISPFLLFYDRLAVADSLLTAFGVWSFYLTVLLIEKPDLGKAFLLGFCWGGGLLTKPPGLYFIFLSPLILLLFFPLNKNSFLKKNIFTFFKTKISYWLLSLMVAVLSYNVIKLSPLSHMISVRSYDYILGKREFLKDPFQLFWGNFKAILAWLYSYQLLPGIILFFLGLTFLIKKAWKKALVFFSWLIIPLLGSAAIGKIIFPRYFLFLQPWIIVFMSFGITELISKVKKFRDSKVYQSLLTGIIYVFASWPWLLFSLWLIFNPVKAPLIEREQNQYLTSWSAGYGIKEVADWLKEHHPDEKVFVATEGFFGTLPDGLQIYLDGFSKIEVYGVGQPIHTIPEKTLERAKTVPTYLVVNSNRAGDFQDKAELIKEYPKPEFPFLKESLLFFKIKG